MEHQGNLDDYNNQEHNWREELLRNITKDEPEPALAPACETPKQRPPSPAKRQQITPSTPIRQRPRRNTKVPAYLKDYVIMSVNCEVKPQANAHV